MQIYVVVEETDIDRLDSANIMIEAHKNKEAALKAAQELVDEYGIENVEKSANAEWRGTARVGLWLDREATFAVYVDEVELK